MCVQISGTLLNELNESIYNLTKCLGKTSYLIVITIQHQFGPVGNDVRHGL